MRRRRATSRPKEEVDAQIKDQFAAATPALDVRELTIEQLLAARREWAKGIGVVAKPGIPEFDAELARRERQAQDRRVTRLAAASALSAATGAVFVVLQVTHVL